MLSTINAVTNWRSTKFNFGRKFWKVVMHAGRERWWMERGYLPPQPTRGSSAEIEFGKIWMPNSHLVAFHRIFSHDSIMNPNIHVLHWVQIPTWEGTIFGGNGAAQCNVLSECGFGDAASSQITSRFLVNIKHAKIKVTHSRRAFSVAGPMAWNSLPDFIRDPTSSTDCFRRLLKTYLFARY